MVLHQSLNACEQPRKNERDVTAYGQGEARKGGQTGQHLHLQQLFKVLLMVLVLKHQGHLVR